MRSPLLHRPWYRRLKSVKNTAMIESIAVVDTMTKATALNYVGAEATGEGWTDKLQRKGGGEYQPSFTFTTATMTTLITLTTTTTTTTPPARGE